jgi:hypothetical protein
MLIYYEKKTPSARCPVRGEVATSVRASYGTILQVVGDFFYS